MRCFFIVIVATLCNVNSAQDPTVPSAKILERLGRGQPASVVASPSVSPSAQIQLPPPMLKLKAVVMTDSDHGVALIEVDSRRLRLRLSRPATEQANASEASTQASLDDVVIQGSTYHVQSFSARSILLSNSIQTLLVQ